MPAKSEAQRHYLYATFGSAWVHRHGYANKGKLPAHVRKRHGRVLSALKGGNK